MLLQMTVPVCSELMWMANSLNVFTFQCCIAFLCVWQMCPTGIAHGLWHYQHSEPYFRNCALNCIQIQKCPFKNVHGWTFFLLILSVHSQIVSTGTVELLCHVGFVCVLILDYAVHIFHSTESRYVVFVLVDANHSKAAWPLSTNSCVHIVTCSTWLWRSD